MLDGIERESGPALEPELLVNVHHVFLRGARREIRSRQFAPVVVDVAGFAMTSAMRASSAPCSTRSTRRRRCRGPRLRSSFSIPFQRSVVGAGSVVTRDVPEGVLAAGHAAIVMLQLPSQYRLRPVRGKG